ncbi:MAG: EutP/PduV family microcompartment system protein [Lachnospiraceae bacterium]|nr:EutP/PduV family microcompartment system protein [Lachnospiraceae bacterium]
MKKLFLMGRSEAGKTSLTQAMKGEELHYEKTQYTYSHETTIDTPGEYAETKTASVGLACFSFDADVIGMLCAADEPFSVFGNNLNCCINRPLIGIITKIDSPLANVEKVEQWMLNAGCERVFPVSNKTREGIDELLDYLEADRAPISLEEAKIKQAKGINAWE